MAAALWTEGSGSLDKVSGRDPASLAFKDTLKKHSDSWLLFGIPHSHWKDTRPLGGLRCPSLSSVCSVHSQAFLHSGGLLLQSLVVVLNVFWDLDQVVGPDQSVELRQAVDVRDPAVHLRHGESQHEDPVLEQPRGVDDVESLHEREADGDKVLTADKFL